MEDIETLFQQSNPIQTPSIHVGVVLRPQSGNIAEFNDNLRPEGGRGVKNA